MYVECHEVEITTGASSGAGEGYTPVVRGRVLAIRYVKTDFVNGSTITVTGETTGQAVWSETGVNASATRAPRQPTHTNLGAAASYDGTRPVLAPIVVAGERIKIAVADAGNSKTGTFYVLIG